MLKIYKPNELTFKMVESIFTISYRSLMVAMREVWNITSEPVPTYTHPWYAQTWYKTVAEVGLEPTHGAL